MKRRLFSLALLAGILFSASFAGNAYGHGLGEDQAPPVTVSEKQVTVIARITPAAVPFDDSITPSLLIRGFNLNDNVTLAGGIDYRIAISLQNETMLDQRFRSSDGFIRANLVPDNSSGWWITGHESGSPQDQIDVSLNSQLEIRSGILAKGGLYHVAVVIEQSSPGIALEKDLNFDLYLSVSHAQDFKVNTTQGEQQMVVKTYYDDVYDFAYQNGTISFEMPFNWNPSYVALVPVLHMEVQFPKTIEELKTNSYKGSLNGVDLRSESVQIDDYTSEEDRIVHFIVSDARLSGVSQAVEDDTDVALFSLSPLAAPRFPLDLLSAPAEKYIFELSWGPDVIETGVPITFVMNIQDPATGEVLRNPSFDFVVSQSGQELYRKRLQSGFGTFAEQYTFSRSGTATLMASNINGEGETSEIDLVVLQGSNNPPPQPPPNQQPSGCLIATAAFGSELAPQVQYLRDFREQQILSTKAGSAFMNSFNAVYYSFSPQVADYEREQPWLQAVVKTALYPLFGILTASERAHFAASGGEFGAVVSGTTASALIGAVYLLPVGFAAARRVKTALVLIALAAAVAVLALSMLALPSLLPVGTSTFVVAIAGTSALMVAKALLRVFGK